MLILAFILTGIVAFVVGAGCCTVFLLWLGWGPEDDDDDDDDDSDDASGSRWMVEPSEPGIDGVDPAKLPDVQDWAKSPRTFSEYDSRMQKRIFGDDR